MHGSLLCDAFICLVYGHTLVCAPSVWCFSRTFPGTSLSLTSARFHFAESVKLNEARAKEWEKLSDNTVTKTSINRDTIVEDMLQLYRENEGLTNTTLEVTFINEPAEDADGLTRELFSQGWKNILPLFFEGTSFHVPRVDPDCSEELFEILGRIASHGFILTGYFPWNCACVSN